MKSMTIENAQALDFRVRRLEEKLAKLESLVSGRSRSLLPLVRTGEKGYDEEKTWRLVDDLLDALETCDGLCACWRIDSADGPPAEADFYRQVAGFAAGDGRTTDWALRQAELAEDPELRFLHRSRRTDPLSGPDAWEMDETVRSFYRCFLYCALRLVESKPFWLVETGGRFEDVLRLAGEMDYGRPEELHFLELCRPGELRGTFRWMDALYEALSGRFIVQEISAPQIQAVRERYPGRLEEMEESWRQTEGDDLPREATEEEERILWEQLESLTDQERENLGRVSRWSSREEERILDWLKAFPEKEAFCRQYLLCRELYFASGAGPKLRRTVRRMLNAYLFAQGWSGYLDEDRFFSAYVLADRAVNQLRPRDGR